MKAKIITPDADGIKPSHVKHGNKTSYIKIIEKASEDVIVEARIYEGSGDTVWAVVWAGAGHGESRGSGSAGGGGYHKGSAALQEAIDTAGLELSERIDGRGEYAMIDACQAVAKCFTRKKTMTVKCGPL